MDEVGSSVLTSKGRGRGTGEEGGRVEDEKKKRKEMVHVYRESHLRILAEGESREAG